MASARFPVRSPTPGGTSGSHRSPFSAVEIRPMKQACESAREASGERYLVAEAPLLPLARCDRREACDCRYLHFSDRRRGPRRKTEGGLASRPTEFDVERRRLRGRRAEDSVAGVVHASEPDSAASLDDSYYGHMSRIFTRS